MGNARRTPEEIKPLLRGVVNVQLTPFKTMTEIDEEALRDNTRFMIEHGIVEGRGVLAVGGSCGEGFSLSEAEYKRLIDVVVEDADGRVPVCVGCVRPATQPVIELAKYAEEAGADCVMVLAPDYFPNEPEDVVYAHFKAVADATDIPIMIYNNLPSTGQDLSVALLRRLAEIEQIVACKECTPHIDKLREEAFYLADRFAILPCATPRTMPFDYQLGAVGFVTWLANFNPAYALEIHDVCLAHDFARAQEMYARSSPLDTYIRAAVRAGGVSREIALAKEMCRLAGRPMGQVERLPIVRPSEDERLMMTSRERVRRTLTFQDPDRAPRDLWWLPGVEMFRKAELDAVLDRFPSDFASPEFKYGQAERASGTPYVVGTCTDEWGCPRTTASPGITGQVKDPPLADWAALDHLRPPDEILDNADFSRVNASCAATDKFVKAGTGYGTTIRPFERMQFLRGTENLLMDLAWGTQEVYRLRDLVHEFFLRELELWVKTDVDCIPVMDDWGGQDRLLVSPQMWREFFKPLYADYCRIAHDAGKFVFFHSDGYIFDFIPEFIEVGIDALNAQLFCMHIEKIGRWFKGKITFWGEIDRQWMLPFGSEDDVRAAVRRVRAALDDGRGGVIAQCEWGNDVSKENAATVFETWEEPLFWTTRIHT